MTDNEYLKRMIDITNELERIASQEPFVQDSWDICMMEMHKVTCNWHVSRRHWPRLFKYVCWFLLGMLAWVILQISC